VVLDNHSAEVETNAGSRLHSSAFVVGSEKCSEHVRRVFFGDPDALILYLDNNFVLVLQLDNRFDFGVFTGVFLGVGNQVRKYLRHSDFIGEHLD
jgi:hypothetical protein